MKPLVIYHANCADGFTAAWAVRQAMDAEFHPGVYGEAPPEVAGRDVILVDFCYPFDVLMQLGLSARSVLVLDHHKSAEASLTSGNCYVGQAGLARVVRLDSLPDARAAWDYYSANASAGGEHPARAGERGRPPHGQGPAVRRLLLRHCLRPRVQPALHAGRGGRERGGGAVRRWWACARCRVHGPARPRAGEGLTMKRSTWDAVLFVTGFLAVLGMSAPAWAGVLVGASLVLLRRTA